MKISYQILAVLFLLASCGSSNLEAPKVEDGKADFSIAFGSCNKQYEPQPLWSVIEKNTPDLFIWGGDNIYADTQDMSILEQEYQVQLNNPAYKNFKESIPIIGIWDDHDYGINDGGSNWKFKEESQNLFLDFFEVPTKSNRRKRKGVYYAGTFKTQEGSIKIMLLDTRYFRSPLVKSTNPNKRYEASPGTILGEKQWEWLETQITNSKADFNIVVSSIQVLSQEHGFEKWDNFPQERSRLLELIKNSKAKNVVLLSGDRHISEFSKIKMEGKRYPLVDFTSSGLTHTYEEFSGEPNKHRVGEVITQKSFGLLKFDFDKNSLLLEMRGEGNKVLQKYKIDF